MRRRKGLFLALSLLLAGLPANAEDTKNEWYLETDTKMSIPMRDVQFLLAADDDTSFSVIAKDNVSYDGVTRVTFVQRQASGINKPVSSGKIAVFPAMVNSTINITGCKSGSKITIVNVSGQIVASASAQNGNTVVDVSNLSAGMYILMVDKQSVKFIKR